MINILHQPTYKVSIGKLAKLDVDLYSTPIPAEKIKSLLNFTVLELNTYCFKNLIYDDVLILPFYQIMN